MSLFLVEYTYDPAKNAERDALRPDHRAWLGDLLERDIVVTSGPFADGLGALIIVDTADADTVALLFTHDPFAKADLLANVRITEWVPVLGQLA